LRCSIAGGLLVRVLATRKEPMMQQQQCLLLEKSDDRFQSFSSEIQHTVLELMAALIIRRLHQSRERPDHDKHLDGK
jgi:hypothetical protein